MGQGLCWTSTCTTTHAYRSTHPIITTLLFHLASSLGHSCVSLALINVAINVSYGYASWRVLVIITHILNLSQKFNDVIHGLSLDYVVNITVNSALLTGRNKYIFCFWFLARALGSCFSSNSLKSCLLKCIKVKVWEVLPQCPLMSWGHKR